MKQGEEAAKERGDEYWILAALIANKISIANGWNEPQANTAIAIDMLHSRVCSVLMRTDQYLCHISYTSMRRMCAFASRAKKIHFRNEIVIHVVVRCAAGHRAANKRLDA